MRLKIKIVIVGGQDLFRRALISHFKEIDQKIQVIGEANNATELLELLKNTKPEVILLDLEMPVMNGEEALRMIKKKYPDLSVVILSGFLEEKAVAQYVSEGALGCLPKECDSEMLLDAIYCAQARQTYFMPSTSRAVLKALVYEKNARFACNKLRLSTREMEVLREIHKGLTSREISQILNITPATVNFHRIRLYRKTGTKNLVSLVKYAIKEGIV